MKSLWLKWMSVASLNLSQRNPCLIVFTKAGTARMPRESSVQTNTSMAFQCKIADFLLVLQESRAIQSLRLRIFFKIYFSPITVSSNPNMRRMLDLKVQLSESSESGIHTVHCAASRFWCSNSCASSCLTSWGSLCHDVAVVTMILPAPSHPFWFGVLRNSRLEKNK